MATYDELLGVANGAGSGSQLYGRVKVACLVACDTIRSEAGTTPNHSNRLKWAATVLQDPDTAAKRMLLAVLAQNRAATLAAITSAGDTTVQTAVDAAVDLVAQG